MADDDSTPASNGRASTSTKNGRARPLGETFPQNVSAEAPRVHGGRSDRYGSNSFVQESPFLGRAPVSFPIDNSGSNVGAMMGG